MAKLNLRVFMKYHGAHHLISIRGTDQTATHARFHDTGWLHRMNTPVFVVLLGDIYHAAVSRTLGSCAYAKLDEVWVSD